MGTSIDLTVVITTLITTIGAVLTAIFARRGYHNMQESKRHAEVSKEASNVAVQKLNSLNPPSERITPTDKE